MIYNKPMEPRVKELWLKALRSGSFEQGKNYLDRHDTYCCLGVLCTIAQAEEVVERIVGKFDSDAIYYGSDGDNDSQVLPGAVMRWADLRDEFAQVTITEEDFHSLGLKYASLSEVATYTYNEETERDDIVIALTSMNDYGASFEKIADMIEKYL